MPVPAPVRVSYAPAPDINDLRTASHSNTAGPGGARTLGQHTPPQCGARKAATPPPPGPLGFPALMGPREGTQEAGARASGFYQLSLNFLQERIQEITSGIKKCFSRVFKEKTGKTGWESLVAAGCSPCTMGRGGKPEEPEGGRPPSGQAGRVLPSPSFPSLSRASREQTHGAGPRIVSSGVLGISSPRPHPVGHRDGNHLRPPEGPRPPSAGRAGFALCPRDLCAPSP